MPGLPMLADPYRCLIVVPCYNEERRLPLARFSTFLEYTPEVRFLFVNDGSRDNTMAVLRELQTRFPGQVDVLDQQPNAGKAEAVRHGFLYALTTSSSAFLGFWDADLATPLEVILPMREIFDGSPDVQMVFGARVRLLGRDIHRKPARHYLGRVFATVVSASLRLPIYDTQCGAKLFRVTPDLRDIFATPFHSKWIFDVEIIARFLQKHRADPHYAEQAIYEYPLPRWQDVAGSRLKSTDFLKAIKELGYIRKTYLR